MLRQFYNTVYKFFVLKTIFRYLCNGIYIFSKFDFPILKCVSLKIRQIRRKFVVAEGEILRPTMAEGKCWCFCGGNQKKMK